jgi:peptide/nickel transport system ATP-binding protein/oligopeptide transport system ATP-binding protein
MATLLEVQDLRTQVIKPTSTADVLNGVSFTVEENEIVGLIGETGAGKSVTAWSVMGLVEPPVQVTGGSARFRGRELVGMSEKELRRVRGQDVALIVQNPRGSLDPLTSIGKQMENAYRIHNGGSRSAARARVLEILSSVGIPDPERRAKAFPHELSGGMAQRILIGIAMINSPALLIADEPTTGLDVTVQAQILDLIKEQTAEIGSSVLMITHDLGVVAHFCDRVCVMFAGRIVESGPVREIFAAPQHPYTRSLINSTPERILAGAVPPRAGQPPDLENLPAGCHYAYRCQFASDVCRTPVLLVTLGDRHEALCHFPEGSR